MEKFLGYVPNEKDVLAFGKQKGGDILGNTGLRLTKALGDIRRLREYLSPIGTESRSEWQVNPQREFLWDFILPSGIQSLDNETALLVSSFCLEVTVSPRKLQGVTDITYGGEKRSYPGRTTVPSIRAKYICPFPDVVGDFFRRWSNLVVSERGFYRPKSQYTGDGSIITYGRDKSVNFKYRVRNLFPISIGEVNLSYNNQNFVSYTIEMSVDRIELDTN